MNEIAAYWQYLGDDIRSRISEHASSQEAFAEIATHVLSAVPSPAIDAVSVAEWMIDTKVLPKQVNLHSSFGEPPLVVYQTESFFMELLFWFPSATSIHAHAFSGAFAVLSGHSIEVEYEFHEEVHRGEIASIGRLEPRSLAFISPGVVHSINASPSSIHRVVHLGNPSLTLVARTYNTTSDRQFRFHRCGFAHDSKWQHSTVARQADVLIAIRKAAEDRLESMLIRLIKAIDECHLFCLLDALLRRLGPSLFVRSIMPVVESSCTAHNAAAIEAVREATRSAARWATLRAFPNRAAQLSCALEDLCSSPSERDTLIRMSYGGKSPTALMAEWQALVCQ